MENRFTAIVLVLGMALPQLAATLAVAQQLEPTGVPAKMALAPGAPAQLPLVDGNGSWVFRRQVNEVTVMFTATRKGKYVDDLQPVDVQVRDDKRPPEEIMDFRNEQGLPMRLGLLIDTSGSVNDRFRQEIQAANQFIKQVVDEQDRKS